MNSLWRSKLFIWWFEYVFLKWFKIGCVVSVIFLIVLRVLWWMNLFLYFRVLEFKIVLFLMMMVFFKELFNVWLVCCNCLVCLKKLNVLVWFKLCLNVLGLILYLKYCCLIIGFVKLMVMVILNWLFGKRVVCVFLFLIKMGWVIWM